MEKEDSVQINLSKSLTNSTIIVGPPNFGMIGTIVTEFLISHLQMKSCGSIIIPGLPAVVAVHEGHILDPIGLYFDETKNILIVHIAANVVGHETQIVDAMLKLAAQVTASKIVCVDGLFDDGAMDVPNVWFVSRDQGVCAKLNEIGVDLLTDGIITGPSATLLAQISSIPMVVLLASSHEQMADSSAAASIVAALDEWLGFGVNSDSLLSYVQQFEDKWRSILSNSAQTKEEKEKKYVSYVG